MSSKMPRTGKVNQFSRPVRVSYANIRVVARGGNVLQTKVSFEHGFVDSTLGNAILEAIAASGVAATGAVVTVRFS